MYLVPNNFTPMKETTEKLDVNIFLKALFDPSDYYVFILTSSFIDDVMIYR